MSLRDSFSPGSPVPQKRLDVPHLIHCKTSHYIIVNKYIFQNYSHFILNNSQKDCPGIRNLILLHRTVARRSQKINPSAGQYTEVRVEVLVGVLAGVLLEFRVEVLVAVLVEVRIEFRVEVLVAVLAEVL